MKRASDGAAKTKATTEHIEPVWYDRQTLADWKRSAAIGDVFCSERFRVKGLHVTDRFLAVRRARAVRGREVCVARARCAEGKRLTGTRAGACRAGGRPNDRGLLQGGGELCEGDVER